MVSVIQHVLTPKSRTGEDSIAGFKSEHRAKVIQKLTCLTAIVERFTQGGIYQVPVAYVRHQRTCLDTI